jgi:selenocysteine lyase/cysteine desulfurase
VAGKLGLAAAMRYAIALGVEAIEARVTGLARALREALSTVPGVRLHNLGPRHCGIVTFTRDGHRPEEIAERLRALAINVSVSSLAFARIDLGARGLSSLVRASVHTHNSEDEIDHFVETLRRL